MLRVVHGRRPNVLLRSLSYCLQNKHEITDTTSNSKIVNTNFTKTGHLLNTKANYCTGFIQYSYHDDATANQLNDMKVGPPTSEDFTNAHCIKVKDVPNAVNRKSTFEYFSQYGRVASLTGEFKHLASSGTVYIMFRVKESASKALANPNHIIDGATVEVIDDDWSTNKKHVFVSTPREIASDKIIDSLRSLGDVYRVKALTRHKKHAGYSVMFTDPTGAINAIKKYEVEIDSIKVNIHGVHTRHCIRMKVIDELRVTLGPLPDKFVEDELKDYISKFGEVHVVQKLWPPFERYYKVIYKDRESVRMLLENRNNLIINNIKVPVQTVDSMQAINREKNIVICNLGDLDSNELEDAVKTLLQSLVNDVKVLNVTKLRSVIIVEVQSKEHVAELIKKSPNLNDCGYQGVWLHSDTIEQKKLYADLKEKRKEDPSIHGLIRDNKLTLAPVSRKGTYDAPLTDPAPTQSACSDPGDVSAIKDELEQL